MNNYIHIHIEIIESISANTKPSYIFSVMLKSCRNLRTWVQIRWCTICITQTEAV